MKALTFLISSLPMLVTQPSPDEVVRIGPGVTPPRVLRKKEPEFSPLARADRIQGTVLLEIIIDTQGRPTDITVISPLGYGLDEEAEKAVEKWEFAPGMKDGHPVKVLATVEVNFRFDNLRFDQRTERRRTDFNEAIRALSRKPSTPAGIEKTVRSIQDLANQKFPPAMHALGVWETTGEYVPKDPDHGLQLIEKAAAKNYGPALYEVGIRRVQGRDLARDDEKGMEELRRAATLGSPQAQFYLGDRYEKGESVPRELDRARRYFRLCAAQTIAMCQYRLGALLVNAPDRSERDYLQGVAWVQLAEEQGLEQAKGVAASEIAKLTPEQAKWVRTTKQQLVRKL